jgi:hypothetical protein
MDHIDDDLTQRCRALWRIPYSPRWPLRGLATWQKQRRAPSTDPSIVSALIHEYEEFPRGRLVYHTIDRQFILYADRRLHQDRTIAAIAHEFGLEPGHSSSAQMNTIGAEDSRPTLTFLAHEKPTVTKTYAIGDIHGCLPQLQRLV